MAITNWIPDVGVRRPAGLGVLEAGLGGLKRLLCAFKWSWAVPERSGDVPGGSRARNIDFSMVLGGLEKVSPRADRPGRGDCPTP